jgi:hypothetical protein
LRFLRDQDHTFFRLWIWEQSRWTLETTDDAYWFHPDTPYLRTGPGTAQDGLPKFDLDQLDPAWFDRLRARVVQARSCGLYVAVGLFNGWSVASAKGAWDVRNPWRGHPFHRDNNINGVDGDTDGDDSGVEVHELDDPTVLAYQEDYVRRTVEALNDLDNVLWEISNESHAGSIAWQYHMIDFIKGLEAGMPLQHPVGMSVVWPNGDNDDLLASPADWIAPNGSVLDPPEVDGAKVLVDDIDHLCGICGDRDWVWKSFLRGRNPVFMDGYDGAGYGVGGEGFVFDDPVWVGLRASMGYANAFARRMDLARVVPHGELASTGYCLARPHASEGEWLIYLDGGGDVQVDLSASSRLMEVEWFDPATGTSQPGDPVMGGKLAVLTPPFSGDAVLYIH